jgi:hypothetical protein
MRGQWWLGLVVCGAGLLWLRRLGERGAATDAEARAALPGDDIIPRPILQTTHAVTVDARPADVWPWLVQMGLYRAGWYADTGWWDAPLNRYLKTLTRAETERTGYGLREQPSADHIMPEFQDLKVGDVILDGPPGTAAFRVAVLEPNQALVLRSTTHLSYVLPRAMQRIPWLGLHGDFTWSFVLDGPAAGPLRLILRTRATMRPRLWNVILPLAWPIDYLTTRRQLRGIKRRVERAPAIEAMREPAPSMVAARGRASKAGE